MKSLHTGFSEYISWAKDVASSDEADSVVVSVVVCFPFIVLMLGWSVDFSKNIVIRSDLDEIALESVQAAIRNQDGVGNVECTNTSWLDYDTAVNVVKSGRGVGSATKQALKSYLMKTGRATAATFAATSDSDMRGDIYNGDGEMDKLAANNDSIQVKAYRSFGGNDDTVDGPTAFRIRISCLNSAARASQGDQKNSGSAALIGGGSNRIDTVKIDVKDWTSNFFLGNPMLSKSKDMSNDGVNLDTESGASFNADSTQVQRFNVSQSAISSWSQDALRRRLGTSH